MALVKALSLVLLLGLSGCSWFHRHKAVADPSELIVTGAPAGSIVFVDGVQAGQLTTVSNRPQIIEVASGEHVVEIRRDDTVAYRESVYVAPSEKHTVTVLSGTNPE
jgi:hypothetical protein